MWPPRMLLTSCQHQLHSFANVVAEMVYGTLRAVSNRIGSTNLVPDFNPNGIHYHKSVCIGAHQRNMPNFDYLQHATLVVSNVGKDCSTVLLCSRIHHRGYARLLLFAKAFLDSRRSMILDSLSVWRHRRYFLDYAHELSRTTR